MHKPCPMTCEFFLLLMYFFKLTFQTRKKFKIMNRRLCIVFFMLITVLLSAQNSLIRIPRISPNAQEMAFSYQGDIWIYNFDTQQSKRLTIHEGYESNPVWNKNGDQLAFSSNRKGANNVFIIRKNGGIRCHNSSRNLKRSCVVTRT